MKMPNQLEERLYSNGSYIEHLTEKAMTSARRKSKVTPTNQIRKRTHWVNRTGIYKDKELQKCPKYWKSQKPVLTYKPIQTPQDLSIAIGLIATGERDFSEYRGVTGINKERLRLAQSMRDRRWDYDISDIMELSFDKIKERLGFGKSGYGRVYHR